MGDDNEMVPRERLDQEIRKTTAANARISEMEAELAKLAPKAQQADTLTSQIADLQSQLDSERTGRQQDQAIYGAGFTDPDLVRFEYGRLPEDGRPAMGEWLEGLRSAPDKAPATLQPFLGGGVGDQEDAGARPDTTRRGRGTAGSQGDTRAEQTGKAPGARERQVALDRAKKRGEEQGDWSEWRKLRGFAQ